MKWLTDKIKSEKKVLLICLMLAAMVWAVFGQTLKHEFINYDDDKYVYENPIVCNGFTAEGIKQAFSPENRGFYYPLTTISFMLDQKLHGMNAGGFHLSNILLHLATSITLFFLFYTMTGSLWRSAFVAAVFAIHPLRVESVAWVTERKDVLSGLFFMLTLLSYVRYARKPFSISGYTLVCVLFAAGLLTKPILVTLPFVLLLLDFWPLCRFAKNPSLADRKQSVTRVLLEKIPLIILAALACIMTVHSHAMLTNVGKPLPFQWRVGNAFVSYVIYIKQMFWPTGLIPHYPHLGSTLPIWKITASFFLLGAISLGVLPQRKKRPYLLLGWLWYLGMLVPVIGIARELGGAAHADRFTYLPQIGLILLFTWLVADLSTGWRHRRIALGTTAMVLLATLMAGARIQTSHWCDSQTLWIQTLAHTKDSIVAHNNLGNLLAAQGKNAEAIEQYRATLRINPDYAKAHYNLGNLLAAQGKNAEAGEQFQAALRINPDYAETRNNLGNLLAAQGKNAEAGEQFRAALRINPDHAKAHYNLGNLLAAQGKNAEADEQYRAALRVDPDDAETRNNLGILLAVQGKNVEAGEQFRAVLRINPDDAETHYNLGNLLAAQGKNDEAGEQFRAALRINPNDAGTHYNLGNLLAAQGKNAEAAKQFRAALRIQPDHAKAHHNLGNLLAAQEKNDEEGEQYRAALRINPDDAEAHYNRGNLLAVQGKNDEAGKQYRAALRINPDYAEAHYNLGVLLAAQRKNDEAVEQFRAALRINPDDAETLYTLGILLAAQGKNAEAVEQFRAALRINPDDAETLYTLGILLAAQGKNAEAVEQFRATLRINPYHAKTRNNLGILLAAQGKNAEAVEQYRAALRINPDYAKTRNNLGKLLAAQGKNTEAVEQFRAVLRINPDHIGAKKNLAWLLATCPDSSIRDGGRAVELARSVDQLVGGRNPEILDTLSAAYAEAGQFTEAIATARRALDAAVGQETITKDIRSHLRLYEVSLPYHEPEKERSDTQQ